mgnify:FL=1
MDEDIQVEYLRQPVKEGEFSDVKYYWMQDDNHGFIPVQRITSSSDEIAQVKLPDQSVKTACNGGLLPANSARFDKHEDMAELGELNEATIVHSLKTRYQSGLVYTYSGLFLVAVNPYKPLPIYSPAIIEWFRGQPRQARPPHIYAVADAALADMRKSHQNQAILITYPLALFSTQIKQITQM